MVCMGRMNHNDIISVPHQWRTLESCHARTSRDTKAYSVMTLFIQCHYQAVPHTRKVPRRAKAERCHYYCYPSRLSAHERRRRWTGHVIRMGETRMPRQATKAVFEDAEGTLIGDLGWEGAWEVLESAAEDKREWRKESKLMREKRVEGRGVEDAERGEE